MKGKNFFFFFMYFGEGQIKQNKKKIVGEIAEKLAFTGHVFRLHAGYSHLKKT